MSNLLNLACRGLVSRLSPFTTHPQKNVIMPFTCRCLNTTSNRQANQSPNNDYVVSKVYHNRNPRNLEKLALARKRLGWKLTAPRKDYYHKLIFTLSNRHTEARLEHFSGFTVLTVSTREWAVRDQLYSCTDVAASENVGRVMAQRCLESGISEVYFDESELDAASDKVSVFMQAFKDQGISLTEPDMVEGHYQPGINYDGYNRYAEAKAWQDDYQKE
ncbi:39S ribosomal protein L18, mitochondrial [Aplysia californica]|uniref:39S ribosomal protein L18, mitochondrial n=1 Tax=Aplysia californica TaxID=6500 RepID=A0ABM0KAN4_APLCA|nr:39S ribosomal protein L18, mitochondrial [Aplysia californica]